MRTQEAAARAVDPVEITVLPGGLAASDLARIEGTAGAPRGELNVRGDILLGFWFGLLVFLVLVLVLVFFGLVLVFFGLVLVDFWFCHLKRK